jgi:ABC-type multidrug transport system permease subunit
MKRITAAALACATVLFLVVNLIHPKEYTRNHEANQIREIADHYTRWQIAHFLTFVALLLFVVVVLGLAWLLYSRLDRMAIAGGLLGLWGLVGLGGVVALDGFTWGAIGEVSTWPTADAYTSALTLKAVQQSHYNLPFYVGALAWLVGLLVLTIGLIRTRVIPAPVGWIFALGVALVGVEGAVQNNTYFIVASAVLAVGGVGVALSLRHDEDSDSTSIGDVQPG